MLDKKQIWAVFLFEFRMGWKAMGITLIINNAFSPGTAKNLQCSNGSRSFAEETGTLKMRGTVASHQKLIDQLRASSKQILLKLHENLPKNSTLTLLWSFSIWSKLQRWKSSVNGCLLSWLKIKNIIVLKSHLLLFYATTTNHFSIELWHATKSWFYTTGNDQPSSWTEKKFQSTSQNQTCTPKRSWSLSGGLLTIWYTAAAAAAKSLQSCPVPLSLGFSRQEHWSGLPFPSPMHESESEATQSCPTLSDPMDCSLRSSSHGIFQARVLEWVAIAFSHLIHYSFLNPSKTITSEKYGQQIDKMYWKLQHLWLTLVNRKDPVLPHNNTWAHVALPTFQKLNKLGYEVLPHLPYSPDLSSTNYNFKHQDNVFAGKILLQPETGRKCFPRAHWIPKQVFLCYRNKQAYFLLAKNMLIALVPILINKDVFEPSYNDLTEKAMAPHSSTLAWQIPWMEEPGRLQSMGSLRVGHGWATSLWLFTFMHWRRKWQPTPVFLPGESQGWGSLLGCRLWGRTELDTTEAT